MNDPHMNLVSAIVRADKAVNEMALALARLKGSIKDAVEYEPPEPSKSEGDTDVCEWKKESDGPSLIYKASCSHSYGIWDWKNLEKCPACGKPIHISERGTDDKG